MHARVIGTAGHIDHGKTSLVRALTGIDTDRLKEEKARGITIELGFAHLTLPGGETVGVVDVPGHERFVRTMVAGAVGLDLVVLVVAADEGVMPQTREHLDICALLGVRRGVVALTKADLVDDELRALAVEELRAALAGSFLAEAPIIACSSKRGDGLPALVAAIAEALRETPDRDASALARLPVDRVFTMKGFGTVVTGTLWTGSIAVGDELVALPGEASVAKVRGVQVHGAATARAVAGQRTALNVTLPLEAVARGQVLARAGELEAGRIVDVRLRLLPSANAPLKRRARLLFFAGTTYCLASVTLLDRGELAPGDSALAQLVLERAMVLLPGDRFIVRGFAAQKNYGTTVGGGVVLRTLGARHRRATPELLATLRANESADATERVALEIARAHHAGLKRRALQARVPFAPKVVDAALQALTSAQRVVRYDKQEGALVAATALASLRTLALDAVRAFAAAHPLADGLGKEELRQRLHVEDARLLHLVLEGLTAAGELKAERELVRLPHKSDAQARASDDLQPLAAELAALYAAARLAPPRPAEAAAQLKRGLPAVTQAIDLLVRGGVLVRMKDLVFARAALDALRASLTAFLRQHGTITPTQWKELVGGSRKFSIPLAEHFDAEKLTLRVGDLRKLRG